MVFNDRMTAWRARSTSFILSLALHTVGVKSRANASDSPRQFFRESGSTNAHKAKALPVAPPIQLFPHSLRSEILVKATGADALRLQRSRTLLSVFCQGTLCFFVFPCLNECRHLAGQAQLRLFFLPQRAQ